MKKIIALGGSNSQHSINKKFASYVAFLIADSNHMVEVLDVNDFSLPMFSVDTEQAIGMQENALKFAKKIDGADFIVLSLAENNGSYNVGFKNLIDWTSRIKDRKLWSDKAMLLMATSPGIRGGAEVLNAGKARFPYMGANIKATFSLPEFYKNFSAETGITDPKLKVELEAIINLIKIENS